MNTEPFVDIHCHLVPGIDDGADDWSETLAMARMAVEDGVGMIICTPHQGGNFASNRGDAIRAAVARTQQFLDAERVPLCVLPGADVRIEADMARQLRRGEMLSLGDHRRHVLLELPHELYFPIEPVLEQLARLGMVGILSHPERNQGILNDPAVVRPLVEAGCLMQVTAGSLTGNFGSDVGDFAQWLVEEDLVHFVASDAHGVGSRSPVMSEAFDVVREISGPEIAGQLCCRNPAQVAAGQAVSPQRARPRRSMLYGWFGRRQAG